MGQKISIVCLSLDGGMDDVFFAGSDEEFGMHEEEIERYMYNIIRRHRYSTWVNSYFLA